MSGEATTAATMTKVLHGRKQIFTDAEEITEKNVLEVLSDAVSEHDANRNQIAYLYKYWKGNQPILYRTKTIREDICNSIVVNHASEIVSFKTGYHMAEPVQYVTRKGRESGSEMVDKLNQMMFSEGKPYKDQQLATWDSVCGISYRIILPDKSFEKTDRYDTAPFELFTPDPRNTFVVYSAGLGNDPMLGVTFYEKKDGSRVYSCYTDKEYFEIEDNAIVKHETHILKDIPIIEYPNNMARMGDFEVVIPLLDAINLTQSNRLDGLEQFVQALLVIVGADPEEISFADIAAAGGIALPDGDCDAKYLIQSLDQSNTQTLIDDMYQQVLQVVGMPNRNGVGSTSDTGSAVLMRDGWSEATIRAKEFSAMFEEAEMRMLRIAMNIIDAKIDERFNLGDIEIRMPRGNYENLLQKSQVLATMLNNPKIHPRLAFTHCGMFVDPESAYLQSRDYWEDYGRFEQANVSDTGEYQSHRDLSQKRFTSRTSSGEELPGGSGDTQESVKI